MSRDAIIATIRANRAKLDELNVKSLAIFGSAIGGEWANDEKLYFTVEFSVRLTFDLYLNTVEFLESLLGNEIDMGRELKPYAKEYVEKHMVQVF